MLLWVEGLLAYFCFGFLFWRLGGVEGDGCSRCSVAAGDDGVLMVVARKTVPTVAVFLRSDREDKEEFTLFSLYGCQCI